MKSEKLTLLLNKVVDVNIPNGVYCRGFLTYNSHLERYSIKVIDVTRGNAAVGSNIAIEDNEAEYVTHADKPKLMGVKKWSLHYRLVKYVLRDKVPTPKTMQSGCPYWWLLMFSIIVVIPLSILRAIGYVLSFIPKAFNKFLENLANNWVENLDDESAFELDRSVNRKDRPLAVKLFLKENLDNYLLERYVLQKYGIATSNPIYGSFIGRIQDKWMVWTDEIDKQRGMREDIAYRERTLKEQKIEEAKAKWDAKIQPITDGIESMFESIGDAWKKAKSLKTLIRRTKQVIGTIITLSAVVASYYIAQIISLLITWAVQVVVNYWLYVIGVLIAIAIILIVIFIGIFIWNWLQGVVKQYKKGKKIWYVEPLIWICWYPIKYVILGIVYGLLYTYKPLKFIFYTLIFKAFMVNAGLLIWGFLKGLWGLFLGSTGIFGEYFSASYSDYCPGIEWIGFDDEEESK